jgi:hypothetical protein
MKKLFLFSLIISFSLFSTSCNQDDDLAPSDETPFQELYDQGIDKYLGVFTPASSKVVSPGVTEHTFTGIDVGVTQNS